MSEQFDLVEKAKREARKKGIKIKPDILIGLRAIQKCHDLAASVPGSAYELYMKTKHPGWTKNNDNYGSSGTASQGR